MIVEKLYDRIAAGHETHVKDHLAPEQKALIAWEVHEN